MKPVRILLIAITLIPVLGFGQTCKCEKNFEWVKTTFEKNDAGFQYVLDKKGKQEYAAHNNTFIQKVKAVKNINECTKLLDEWLAFFRAGHIGIRPLETTQTKTTAPATVTQTQNDKWETVNVDVPAFEQYLNNKKTVDYEGVWETSSYKIGIKKEGENYLGFIIESGYENWKKGQLKLKIYTENGKTKALFYLRDKSVEKVNEVELLGNNYLSLGNFTLNRLSPKLPGDKSVEDYFKSLSADKPYMEELNKTTLLLRIPTFDGSAKQDIDSVIASNKDKLLHTENLIIDLRNNGGGSDGSFQKILPFIYTNPIRVVGVEFYSTKLNNQRMLDFINNPEYGFDEESKKWAKECYDKLEKHLGEFVNLDSAIVGIDTLKEVYANPKNVGIIINEGNRSTTEQFLLAAKQSKKVKLFGTTTFGILDVSNMYFVKSPCNEFELGYSLSRSMRIPEMTIDGKGIQPDYYLDKSIPQYKWVDFVNEVLNAK